MPADRRARRVRGAGAALALTLLAGACSGGAGRGGQAAGTTTTVAPATSTTALPQPAARCPDTPAGAATVVRFKARDGVLLDGAMVGGGPAGVLLLHEYPADLCGGWPFAVYLARQGLRVLAIDLRCFGLSACPDADAARALPFDDVAGGIAELERRGARRVVLVGASLGGTVALMAGAALRPPVAGVVSLSGEAELGSLLGGSLRLDALKAVPRLVSPTLIVLAEQDHYVSPADGRAMLAATRAKDKRLVVLGGDATGLHGWTMLPDPSGSGWSPAAREVAAWVGRHARG